MVHSRIVLAGAAAGCLAALAIAAPAGADPSKDPAIPIVCDNGHTYEVTVNGNGEFTPAHDTASNMVLVPTSFGDFHFVVTDSDGNVIEEETDPGLTKGHAQKSRRTAISCTFSFHEEFEDPDLGTLTFEGSGSVTGFTTPAR